MSMSEYAQALRELEKCAQRVTPCPLWTELYLTARATGWKTLSVFVRDCVGGNCFPIDSRVEKELVWRGLPRDERVLVGLCLRIGENRPASVPRMFYESGGLTS